MRVDDEYTADDPPVILGRGGNGVVVEVEKRSSGERFAMKTVKLEGLDERERQELRLELEIQRGLTHPNIARIFESFEANDHLHIVMELCTGGSLCDRINLHPSGFSEKCAATLAEKMCSAINYCHAHSVIHRDIKLDNFVYESDREDAELKLIDFGFAFEVQPGKREDMYERLGTLSYMAPELVGPKRQVYDSSVDMWAIGVTTYAMLCGRKPFRHEDRAKRKLQILNDEVPVDGSRFRGVSEGAKDFVRKLMTKDPRSRMNGKTASQHPWIVMVSELRRSSNASTRPRSSRCPSDASICSTPRPSDVATSFVSGPPSPAGPSPALSPQASSAFEASVSTASTKSCASACGSEACGSACGSSPPATLSSDVVESLQTFAHSSEFKRQALEAIALATPPALLEELRKVFVAMDADNSGTLSLDEFRRELAQHPELDAEEIERIFRAVDLSKAGVVDVGEFFGAALLSRKERSRALSYPSLIAAFSMLDRDHDGCLSRQDLTKTLARPPAAVDALLSAPSVGAKEGRKSSTCGDGLSFEDFKFLCRTSDVPITSPLRRHWGQRFETVCQNVSPMCGRKARTASV